MNLPPESDDPLLQALATEAQALPAAAAAEARVARRHRRTGQRAGLMMAGLATLALLWWAQRNPSVEHGTQLAKATHHTAVENPAVAITEREREVLTALPDAPLLIVRNAAGGVARVHVFER